MPTRLSRRTFTGTLAACAASTSPMASWAQPAAWPTRAVRIIAAAPAGGSVDRQARLFAGEFAKALGQPFVVENRPGAGGTIGSAAVLSAGDGHTLLMSGVFNAISPALYAKLPYHYLQDFVHIGPTTYGPNVLVAKPDFAASTLAQLIALVKAQPGKVDFASAGVGTSGHLTMEIFQRAAGIQLNHVAYKGGAPAMQDVLAGMVPLIATNQDAVLPLVKAGKLKAIAVTSPQRNPAFPGVPTFVEAGLGDVVVTSWGAMAAPRGTPTAVVERLRAIMQATLRQPAVRQGLEADGWVVMDMAPAEFDQFVRQETEKWARVVRAADIKME